MWRVFSQLLSISGELALTLVLSLTTAFILGLAIAFLYRGTHRGLSYEPSFPSTLVLLAPIVSLVMLFIQGSLVISLGLVGSLSIIRFRTPIKDTRDMAFLFWVIATGIGCGVKLWTPTIMATVLLAAVVCFLYALEHGRPRYADFVLVISGTSPFPVETSEEVIRCHTVNFRIRSHEVQGDRWEKVFELRFSKAQETGLDRLLRDVQDVPGVDKVSLLAPQLSLPM
jgi:hypothetical protein